MIIAIGIDSVEINRFIHWPQKNNKQLLCIFSQQEIDYCLQNKVKSAERFAVRFAAREAFFKALAHLNAQKTIPFLTLCKKIYVKKNDNNVPELIVDWDYINKKLSYDDANNIKSFISLTHTKKIATAFVLLEK